MKICTILKSIGAAAVLISPLADAYGRLLGSEEALQRALSTSSAKHMPGKQQFSLSYSEKIDGNDLVYIFDKDNDGFIVVSGDDNMPALLGYSDSGCFDTENASPEFMWWISQYAEQAYSSKNLYSDDHTSAKFAATHREEIKPLIKTLWGQSGPYNRKCPKIGNKLCVTGCVATAMAQVVKYHSYPERGTNIHSYMWNDTELVYDYENSYFDFDNMLNSYRVGLPSIATRDAVAELMYACGVGVNMNYGTNSSGAQDKFVPHALRHHFNFDKGVRMLKREYFTKDEWENLIYNELNELRPVLYGGQSSEGGHEFVCDGYKDGYFHINWGWTGSSDGYFLLTNLNPTDQGIGSYEGGYNNYQSIIIGIQPDNGTSTQWYPLYATGEYEQKIYNNRSVTLNFLNKEGVFNFSREDFDVSFYIKAISESNEEYIATSGTRKSFSGSDNGTSYGSYQLKNINLPTGLPAGDYKAYLIFKTPEGNFQEVLFPTTVASYFNLHVSDTGKMTSSPGIPREKADIRVTELKSSESFIENGSETEFSLTILNDSDLEYAGIISMNLYDKDSQKLMNSTGVNVSVAPGKIFQVRVGITYDLPSGNYYLQCLNKYGEVISEALPIFIGDAGVEDIFTAGSSVDIFTANGLLVKEKTDREFIRSLPSGVYIVVCDGKSTKIVR